MGSRFYPYTKAEAVKIVKQYFVITNKAATEYLDYLLDFADKYITDYSKWCLYPGSELAEMEYATRTEGARKLKEVANSINTILEGN